MKKQASMLIILALLTFKGISQTASTSDSTSIPNTQLRKAINIIEIAKVQKKELELTQYKLSETDSLLIIKNKIIDELKKKTAVQDSMIVGYKGAVKNLEKSLANSNISFGLQSAKYQKEKYKKWGTLALGVLIGFLISK